MKTTDPMEQLIEGALICANAQYRTDLGGGNPAALDFYLPEHGVHIEVKRFHSPRVADQMSRAENVIVAQGELAVMLLSRLIQAGLPLATFAASCDTHPKGGDVKQAPFMGSAVPEGETP